MIISGDGECVCFREQKNLVAMKVWSCRSCLQEGLKGEMAFELRLMTIEGLPWWLSGKEPPAL